MLNFDELTFLVGIFYNFFFRIMLLLGQKFLLLRTHVPSLKFHHRTDINVQVNLFERLPFFSISLKKSNANSTWKLFCVEKYGDFLKITNLYNRTWADWIIGHEGLHENLVRPRTYLSYLWLRPTIGYPTLFCNTIRLSYDYLILRPKLDKKLILKVRTGNITYP